MTDTAERHHLATGTHPDVERSIAGYRRGFWQAMRRSPARQTARILIRRAKEFSARRSDPGDAARAHSDSSTIPVPAMLRPPSYHYRGYRGPWLEEHFRATWENTDGGAAYLPVFFDSIFFHAQCSAFLPSEFAARYRALWRVLFAVEASQRPCFTLLGMYDFPIWEWHLFPRNVVVAAANGYGDVAIPLLKGDRPLRRGAKDIRVSFMGATNGGSNVLNVRSEMRHTFDGLAHFGEGANWEDIMARSDFSLCPRGLGPTSFRLFEALSVSSIPIYVWKVRSWLPYADELDWSSFSLVVEAGEMNAAKETLLRMSAESVRRMQERIAEIYPRYFTYDAACARIRERFAKVTSLEMARTLTGERHRFEFAK
ncbi:MAG TPA: exostosin family protein [Opitutaceae bacterium]|nr:exostosin family protein [Opitutaceae bacterium]